MFRFAAEQMLFAYVVIPVLVGLAWWVHVRRCRDLLQIADPTLLERLTSTVNRPGRMAKTVLYVTAVGLLVTALARPQFGTRVETVAPARRRYRLRGPE